MKRNLTLLLLFVSVGLWAQGTTTSSMRGKIVDGTGEVLIGANVVATHGPTAIVTGTATDVDGQFYLPNMRVGGPYRLEITYTGFSTLTFENIFLRLGEAFRRDVVLEQSSVTLDAVQVIASAGVTGQSAGASTQINAEDIEILPTLDRNLNDFLRLTPQASAFGSGISFAGVNNRFNAIYIDGAVNNDVFGLAGSGTNGGQTGISPFSIDIIDQLQVVLSPYDVSLGGFAGGGINAVTKSGTNNFSGTAYYYLKNEGLAGKTNGTLAERLGLEDDERTKLADFSETTYGLSLGGPIVKDKVFFFANVEIQNDETPIAFEVAQYTQGDGRASEADLESLRNTLINEYGYDPGGFRSTADELEGTKIFAKLDFQLNDKNRLTVRHQFTKAEQFNRSGGSSSRINFSNNGVFFPSTTNSTAIELNSRFGTKHSNNLILGFTSVRDDRDPLGQNFPRVVIDEPGNGSLVFGSEEFSTANELQSDVFTITNNFKIYNGDHTWTIGTHNEFYSIYNVFIRQNFGSYDFGSLQEFLDNAPADDFDRSYSLVDDITGDGTAAAADFNALQLGLYVQDEWRVNQKFTLTAGLRLDLPIISSDPALHSSFENTLSQLQSSYPIANDINVGEAPDGQLMISPRVGFDYDVSDNRSSVVRGGVGVFTSRIPFVWPGAMFNNNGLTIGGLDERDVSGDIFFEPDPSRQLTNPNFTVPSGQVDLFAKDFKYPQVLRGNLAWDKRFTSGLILSLEGLYTKTLNNIVYTNVNSDPTVDFNWTGAGGDNRPVFTRSGIDETYTAIYVGHNTSKGFAYNLTASVAKDFASGFNAYLAYTYGDAEAVNEGTSSQNSSQWRGQVHTDGRNNPVLGRSDYAAGHRIISALSYRLGWGGSGVTATTFSLFFNGEAGTPFSYVIGGRNARNLNNEDGSTSRNRSLFYVPANEAEANLIDLPTTTAAQQWANLNALIEDDPALRDRRGQYVEKNGAWSPFSGMFDFAIRQDLGANLGGNTHKFQISLDIFNMANLISNKWGVNYFVPGDFNNYFLTTFEGYAADGTTPEFTYSDDEIGKDRFNIGGTSSRWQGRLGFRYIFN